jgi:hypothetical protein
MEETQNNQQVAGNAKNPDKKGINLWKFISIILIVAFLGVGLYELGKSQIPSKNTFVMSPRPTAQTQATASATITPSITITIMPTGTTPKKVNAGIKNLLFSPYAVTVPSGWVDAHTTNTASDTLTITKGQYVLTISQQPAERGVVIILEIQLNRWPKCLQILLVLPELFLNCEEEQRIILILPL